MPKWRTAILSPCDLKFTCVWNFSELKTSLAYLNKLTKGIHSVDWKNRSFYVNTTGYLKNHQTKHRHVCTHCYTSSMLILNMDTEYNNSKICERKKSKNVKGRLSVIRKLIIISLVKSRMLACYHLLYLFFMFVYRIMRGKLKCNRSCDS